MHNSELITPQHLARKAVIYIRQSTPHQVLSHQESLAFPKHNFTESSWAFPANAS